MNFCLDHIRTDGSNWTNFRRNSFHQIYTYIQNLKQTGPTDLLPTYHTGHNVYAIIIIMLVIIIGSYYLTFTDMKIRIPTFLYNFCSILSWDYYIYQITIYKTVLINISVKKKILSTVLNNNFNFRIIRSINRLKTLFSGNKRSRANSNRTL